jgi:glutaredoxin-like protein
VHLKVFTTLTGAGYRQCPACENVIDLVKQLKERSAGLIDYEEISITEDPDAAAKYKVERAPTIIVQGHGIRYTGAPIGQEAAPFVFSVVMASNGAKNPMASALPQVIFDRIKKSRVELIVTPTCPYCAQAALIENALAMLSNGKIVIDIVESYENPDIAKKYGVSAVPVTVVNGTQKIVGVPNVAQLLAAMT